MADKRIFDLEEEGFLDDITDKVYMWLDKKANEGETQEPSWKFKANVFLKILNNFATKFVPNVLTVEGKCYWHDGELFVCNVAYTGDWVPGNFTRISADEFFARKDVLSALQNELFSSEESTEKSYTSGTNVNAISNIIFSDLKKGEVYELALSVDSGTVVDNFREEGFAINSTGSTNLGGISSFTDLPDNYICLADSPIRFKVTTDIPKLGLYLNGLYITSDATITYTLTKIGALSGLEDDIADVKEDITSLEEEQSSLRTFATTTANSVAPDYDDSKAGGYKPNEVVNVSGEVYRAKGDVPQGSFTASKWEKSSVLDIVRQFQKKNPVVATSKSNGRDSLVNAILDVRIRFKTKAVSDSFWSTGITVSDVTYPEKRIGAVILQQANDRLGFYYIGTDGNYVSKSAFDVYKANGEKIVDDVYYHMVADADIGDGNRAVIEMVIDWSKIEWTATIYGYNWIEKDFASKDHFGWLWYYYALRQKANGLRAIVNRGTNAVMQSVSDAVLDAKFEFESTSDENDFWASKYTNGSDEYSLKLGPAVVNSSGLSFYWYDEKFEYVSGASAFAINESDGVTVAGDIKYHEISTTLNGYSVKIKLFIDWGRVDKTAGTYQYCVFDNDVLKNPHAGLIQSKELSSNSALPNFSQLNFAVDGDSITAGNQWSYYVAGILGFKTHVNNGVGSSSYACKQITYDGDTYIAQEYDNPDFAGIANGAIVIQNVTDAQKVANNCARCHVQKYIAEVTNGDHPAPDIFCFAFGTNDFVPTDEQVTAALTGASLPTAEGSTDMASGMRYAVQKIKQTYPNCKIFVLLPIQRAGALSSTDNANNLLKIEAIKKVAQAMSVPVINMFDECGIAGLLENGTGPYLSDGLHPNEAGRKLMGAFAAERIIALYGRHLS